MDKLVFKRAIEKGFKVLPVKQDKVPCVPWTNGVDIATINQLGDIHGVGLVCGAANSGIEVIDVDSKYDTTGNLWPDFKDLIKGYSQELFDKLVIQGTVGGGYHLIYRCKTIDGNKKLARRRATAYESSLGERYKVLIETRGEGGYIVIAPTEGYEFIQGKLSSLSYITEDERALLHGLAMSFDEVNQIKEVVYEAKDVVVKTVLDDYNNKATEDDVLSMLEQHGWTIVRRTSTKAVVKRANADSAHSGYYHYETKKLVVFTTSSEFEPERGYSPAAVYCMLECDWDFKKAVKQLSALGYGEVIKDVQQPVVSKPQDFESKIVKWNDIDKDAEDYYEGRMPVGRGIGIYELDKYYRLRNKAMITFVGSKGHGKTTTAIWLLTMDAWFHGSKWMLLTLENESYEIRDQIISFLLCEDAKAVYLNDKSKYSRANEFVREHFTFLKNDAFTDAYHIMEVAKEINTFVPHNGIFIDPLNSIPKPKDMFNEYTHHSALAAFIQTFAKKNLTVFLTVHPNSSKQRDGTHPKDVDAEFGAVYPNKADITFSGWRDVKSTVRNVINFGIDKVRNKKMMGGDETNKEHPLKFTFVFNGYGYRIEVPDNFGNYREFGNPLESSSKVFTGEVIENKEPDNQDVDENDEWSYGDDLQDPPF